MRAPFALGAVLTGLAVGLLFSVPGASAARTPCWKTVIADWAPDRTLNVHYPVACVREAMENAPTDLKVYSSLEDDLQAALRARSSRQLSGVRASAAGVVGSGQPSSASFLIALLSGLGALVLAAAGIAVVVRRRRTSTGS
jgi:hypothetical protein